MKRVLNTLALCGSGAIVGRAIGIGDAPIAAIGIAVAVVLLTSHVMDSVREYKEA